MYLPSSSSDLMSTHWPGPNLSSLRRLMNFLVALIAFSTHFPSVVQLVKAIDHSHVLNKPGQRADADHRSDHHRPMCLGVKHSTC